MTDNDSPLNEVPTIEDLLHRLADEADALRALADASRAHSKAIANDDARAVEAMLDSRQRVIDGLSDPRSGLFDCLSRLESRLRESSECDRAEAANLLARVESHLAEVIRMDAQSVEAMQSRIVAVTHEIAQGRSVRTAHSAYGRAGGDSNRFMDRKG